MKRIKHLEKRDKKYIIGSVEDGSYLVYKNHKYSFVKNVSYATKFTSRQLAEKYVDFYLIDTMDYQYPLIVIPLEIEYNLIEEVDTNE